MNLLGLNTCNCTSKCPGALSWRKEKWFVLGHRLLEKTNCIACFGKTLGSINNFTPLNSKLSSKNKSFMDLEGLIFK